MIVCASETWAVRVEEEQRMERNENVMLKDPGDQANDTKRLLQTF